MKIVKPFCFIAPLAVIAMALLGPSAAMGESTSLCKADENPCESPVSHVHYATVGKIIVVTSVMTYECKALFLAAVSELGSPQVLEGNFTYTSCNNSCTRTEENGPAVLQFLKTGPESGEAIGESLVHVDCPFIDCYYTLEGMTAVIKGPLLSSQANGELTFVEQEMRHESGGAFCPEEAYLTATFVPLSATYISS